MYMCKVLAPPPVRSAAALAALCTRGRGRWRLHAGPNLKPSLSGRERGWRREMSATRLEWGVRWRNSANGTWDALPQFRSGASRFGLFVPPVTEKRCKEKTNSWNSGKQQLIFFYPPPLPTDTWSRWQVCGAIDRVFSSNFFCLVGFGIGWTSGNCVCGSGQRVGQVQL